MPISRIKVLILAFIKPHCNEKTVNIRQWNHNQISNADPAQNIEYKIQYYEQHLECVHITREKARILG